jgi:7,8-dihydropterin-6-yl-methyl-4-(beta-D-ribofuranosyl)aminobenzene 5'-phosphate synthase
MNLKILYDSPPCPEGYVCGHGFSCLVDGRLLFDTGPDYPSLENNLKSAGVDAAKIEEVFLSHEHADHAGGLAGLLEKYRIPRTHVPGGVTEELKRMIAAYSQVVEHREPARLGENLFSTGSAAFEYKGLRLAEQSLVIRTIGGLALITGCGHTGVAHIARGVLESFPGETMKLLAGGFHLRDAPPAGITAVAAALRSAGVARVAPCHCTGAAAAKHFESVYGKDFIKVSPGFSADL